MTSDNQKAVELATEYLTAMEQAAKHAAIAKDLAAMLLDLVPVGESVEIVPGVGIKVQAPSRRFDGEVARELLTDEEFEAICELVPSVKLARKLLPGNTVDMMSPATGRPSVRIL
jgi:hypothetical protein